MPVQPCDLMGGGIRGPGRREALRRQERCLPLGKGQDLLDPDAFQMARAGPWVGSRRRERRGKGPWQ